MGRLKTGIEKEQKRERKKQRRNFRNAMEQEMMNRRARSFKDPVPGTSEDEKQLDV